MARRPCTDERLSEINESIKALTEKVNTQNGRVGKNETNIALQGQSLLSLTEAVKELSSSVKDHIQDGEKFSRERMLRWTLIGFSAIASLCTALIILFLNHKLN